MTWKFTIVLSIFMGSLQAQDVSWHKVLRGDNPFNPSMNEGCVTADSDGYWASHLTKQAMSYGQTFLGNIAAVHLDFKGEADDSILFTGKAHMRFMRHINGKLFMWLGFFDSIRIGTLEEKRPGNYHTLLCYRDKNGIQSLGVMADTVMALTVLHSGHVAMITGGGFGSDATLHVFTPMGGFYETKTLPRLGFVQGIEETSNGGLLITGSCMGTQTAVDSVNVTNPFTYTNYVMYLDQQRKAKWMRIIEDITCIASAAVGDGNVTYWSGSTFVVPEFDGLSYSGGKSISFDDFFVTRIENKKFQWVGEIPSDTTFATATMGSGNSMGMDSEGNVYILGTVRGNPIHWDSATVTGKFSNSYNVLLVSYDASGDLRWVKDMGGRGYDMGLQMVVKGVDNLFLSAVVSDTFELDGKTIPADYGDILVVKIGEEQLGSSRPVLKNQAITVYPNPASKALWHTSDKVRAFEMFHADGRCVLKGDMLPGKPINTSNLPAGLYYLRSAEQNILWIKKDF